MPSSLNFTGLEYMNSGGIGLLVTLLVRANRAKQKLLAYGLTEHYRQIFELTRLDEAIGIYDTEAEAARRGLTTRRRSDERGIGSAGGHLGEAGRHAHRGGRAARA